MAAGRSSDDPRNPNLSDMDASICIAKNEKEGYRPVATPETTQRTQAAKADTSPQSIEGQFMALTEQARYSIAGAAPPRPYRLRDRRSADSVADRPRLSDCAVARRPDRSRSSGGGGCSSSSTRPFPAPDGARSKAWRGHPGDADSGRPGAAGIHGIYQLWYKLPCELV